MIRAYIENRLAYYGRKGDSSGFWSSHWETVDWQAWLDGAKTGALGYFERPFLKYLPRQGKILEAGCGVGQLVVALRARGYDAEGVEFSEKTVSMVKQYLDSCPIRVGDVRRLDYPDNYFSAYISVGVMEHFEDGPEPVLEEAFRVLESGGYLLVSVPRIHTIRRMKAWLGFYSKQANGDFYQYAFRNSEFIGILENNGFSVESQYYYSSVKGIKDEVPLFNHFYKRNQIPAKMIQKIEKSPLLNRIASHMVLFVAKKAVNANQASNPKIAAK